MAERRKPKLDVGGLAPDQRAVLQLMRQRMPVVLLQRLGGRAEISDADLDAVDGLTILFEADEQKETLILSVARQGGPEAGDG